MRISPARTAATGVLAIGCGVLSGCAAANPVPSPAGLYDQPVEIVVDKDSMDQRVLGEIYRDTLREEDRSATIIVTDDVGDNEEQARGRATLWMGCTGELLAYYDPVRARELEAEFARDQENPSGQDFLALTHIGLIGGLPPELMTVDPSPAEGCRDGSEVDLPNNLVPIFYKTLLDRDEKNAIASVTKFLTTQDLEDLGDAARESGSVEQTVQTWLENSLPAAEIDAGSDSDSQQSSGGLLGDSDSPGLGSQS